MDYTLCQGTNCPRRDTCNRYLWLPMADPQWQSYAVPSDCIENNYETYWKAKS